MGFEFTTGMSMHMYVNTISLEKGENMAFRSGAGTGKLTVLSLVVTGSGRSHCLSLCQRSLKFQDREPFRFTHGIVPPNSKTS